MPTPRMLVGDRGVGKSVLLVHAASEAGALGWPTVAVEARTRTHLDEVLASALVATARRVEETPERRWKTGAVTLRTPRPFDVAEVTVEPTEVSGVGLGAAFDQAIDAVAAKGAGLVVTIDEVHVAGTDSLSEVAAAVQALVPGAPPVVVVFAGLPAIRRPGNMVTYLERCVWHDIGMLSPAETVEALDVPVRDSGRRWAPDALEAVAARCAGYPFAVQTYGYQVWRHAGDGPELGVDAARAGLYAGEEILVSSMYRSRWEALAHADVERAYLATAARLVLASDDRATSNGEIATELGRSARDLSTVRQRCLDRGNLVASGRTLRFPTPGMAEWIAATAADTW